jgi:hypothetical protein
MESMACQNGGGEKRKGGLDKTKTAYKYIYKTYIRGNDRVRVGVMSEF